MSGVYVSYPFCEQKCSFCNFASGTASAEKRRQYERALLEEIRAYEWKAAPDTIYVGGGTPSTMPVTTLAEILSAISRASLREVTLECAPGTVSLEAATAWERCGVNRISLGVQSFVDAELRQTGRRHSAQTVRDDVSILRAAGLTNLNIDLIAGLPHQTVESWEASLDVLLELAPPHLSVYIFEVDEDSHLGNEMLSGGMKYGAGCVPSEDVVSTLYRRAAERLEKAGVHRYEISNFAISGYESIHNLKYWRQEPYVGFGADAHSFDGAVRWSNPESVDDYLRCSGRRSNAEATDLEEEHFFVGLRLTGGIVPSAAEWARFADPIAKWRQSGFLRREGERLCLSPDGVLISNEIFQDFLA